MSQVRVLPGALTDQRTHPSSRAGVLRGGTRNPAFDAKAQARVVRRGAPAPRLYEGGL